jgi:hypothetical protein
LDFRRCASTLLCRIRLREPADKSDRSKGGPRTGAECTPVLEHRKRRPDAASGPDRRPSVNPRTDTVGLATTHVLAISKRTKIAAVPGLILRLARTPFGSAGRILSLPTFEADCLKHATCAVEAHAWLGGCVHAVGRGVLGATTGFAFPSASAAEIEWRRTDTSIGAAGLSLRAAHLEALSAADAAGLAAGSCIVRAVRALGPATNKLTLRIRLVELTAAIRTSLYTVSSTYSVFAERV